MTSFYTISDFNIFSTELPQYSLSETVLQVFRTLEVELNITTSSTMNSYSSMDRPRNTLYSGHGGGGGGKRRHISQSTMRRMDETWEKTPVLKTTVISIAREGIDKKMSELRNFLNKISTKTYENMKTSIITIVCEIMQTETENKTEDIQKIVHFIFDTGCTNKFYSELYAQLYKELIGQFPVFREVITPFIEKYIESIREVKCVDQNKDYDGFCENNKKNEKRKATTAFMMNLYTNGILSSEIILDIFNQFQTMAVEYIEDASTTNEVDEITENIFLMVSMVGHLLKDETNWTNQVLPNIHRFASFKMKEKSGLSSRTIFKYKDIVEKVLKA